MEMRRSQKADRLIGLILASSADELELVLRWLRGDTAPPPPPPPDDEPPPLRAARAADARGGFAAEFAALRAAGVGAPAFSRYFLVALKREAAASTEMLATDMRLLWHPYTSTTRPLPCLPVRSASGVRGAVLARCGCACAHAG